MKGWMVGLLMLLVVVSIGASKKETVIKLEDRSITLKQLAEVVPGMGTIMIEVGNRFTEVNFAGKAGNWDLVGYQLKEMEEIMKVGEITRPKRKKAIKKFLGSAAYKKLKTAVKNKNAAEFQAAVTETTTACNGCHKGSKLGYVQYEVPKTYTGNLKLTP